MNSMQFLSSQNELHYHLYVCVCVPWHLTRFLVRILHSCGYLGYGNINTIFHTTHKWKILGIVVFSAWYGVRCFFLSLLRSNRLAVFQWIFPNVAQVIAFLISVARPHISCVRSFSLAVCRVCMRWEREKKNPKDQKALCKVEEKGLKLNFNVVVCRVRETL